MQKVSDSNKSIAGYRIFRVITGSMEPEYEVGEVVISKEVDPKNIKIGGHKQTVCPLIFKQNGAYGSFSRFWFKFALSQGIRSLAT